MSLDQTKAAEILQATFERHNVGGTEHMSDERMSTVLGEAVVALKAAGATTADLAELAGSVIVRINRDSAIADDQRAESITNIGRAFGFDVRREIHQGVERFALKPISTH